MKATWLWMLFSLPLMAQSNIGGTLPVTLVDGGTDCAGRGRLVDIHADPTGLSGNGGALAGINGFVLVVKASRPGLLTSVLPGSTPSRWHMRTTARPLTDQIRIVGWSTDTNAPNLSYHLATLVLTGTQGPVTISLETGTEVASRLVAPGNGPALMSLTLPAPLNVNVPVSFNLNLLTGVAAWLAIEPDYDLAAPSGALDILDLVKLVTCSPH